jgi:hypothetical protein
MPRECPNGDGRLPGRVVTAFGEGALAQQPGGTSRTDSLK